MLWSSMSGAEAISSYSSAADRRSLVREVPYMRDEKEAA